MRRAADPFSSARLVSLEGAWARYQAVRRRVWTWAAHTERRYLRTSNRDQYTQDRRTLTSLVNMGIREWTANVRKICGRLAYVEAVGTAVGGTPACFLVRVPKAGPGELGVEERIFGSPARGDHAGIERVDFILRDRHREHARRAAQGRTSSYYRRMCDALTEARTHLALKEQARLTLSMYPARGASVTAATQALRHRSYFHHARMARCMARASVYKNKLAKLGLKYDFGSIETPITLPPAAP